MSPEISPDAEVAESAVIEGDVTIQKDAVVFEYSVIKGPCTIGQATVVGSHSLIRESTLGDGCVVGAHAEVARSRFDDDSGMHSGFAGDLVVGRGSRLGAGLVVANRPYAPSTERGWGDRQRTHVGDGVNIAVNCSLMPGVKIGDDAFVGPNTVVEEDVPAGSRVFVDQNTVVKR